MEKRHTHKTAMLFVCQAPQYADQDHGHNKRAGQRRIIELPTTVEHDTTYNRHAVALAQPIERTHVLVEALGREVQATTKGTALVVSPSDIDQESASIQDISEYGELPKQIFLLEERGSSCGGGQGSIPSSVFLGHGRIIKQQSVSL